MCAHTGYYTRGLLHTRTSFSTGAGDARVCLAWLIRGTVQGGGCWPKVSNRPELRWQGPRARSTWLVTGASRVSRTGIRAGREQPGTSLWGAPHRRAGQGELRAQETQGHQASGAPAGAGPLSPSPPWQWAGAASPQRWRIPPEALVLLLRATEGRTAKPPGLDGGPE